MNATELNDRVNAIEKATNLKYMDGETHVYISKWPLEAQKYVVEVWGQKHCLSMIAKFIGRKVSMLYENIQSVFYSEEPEPEKEMWETMSDWQSGRVLRSTYVEWLPSDYKPSIVI